jgi:dCTP deaminase
MILSDKTIRRLRIVSPCCERTIFRGKSYGLSSAGYDVRIDLTPSSAVSGTAAVMTPDGNGILLEPGQSALVGLVEHFDMPTYILGYVRDKSTWARQGLLVAQAVLEPGWKGYMALRIVNLGNEALTIVDHEPIAQVVFHMLEDVPENTYSGKYQGQGRGPQGPRLEL